jgi:UDP-GlcNAc3NAcA epimerase
MKILSVIGARPQFIKSAMVSRVIRENPSLQEVIIHTGQHYDANMSAVFFDELKIPEPHYNLGVGSGSHAVMTGKILQKLEEVLLLEKPDWTLVYGDTNSTVAGALASSKLHIRVAHVEAGLRSFNRTMPEEINRIVTDRISDMLFAPTQTAVANLEHEGLSGLTHFTGDVMYDSVLFYKKLIEANPGMYKVRKAPSNYYLITVHRAENTDNPHNLKRILEAITGITLPVIFPIHPRTKKAIRSIEHIPSNIIWLDPVGYLEMMQLVMDAKKVLTDSGGLQKEAYFLGKQCITLRNETEWIETLHDNWNILAGTDPEKILAAIDSPLLETRQNQEFGDGNAAKLIANNLSQE